MGMTRREFVLAGLALTATGCAQQSGLTVIRPGPVWPETAPPRSTLPPRTAAIPPKPPVTPTAPAAALPIPAIARAQWAKADPIASRINPINGIDRLTVHHEGSTAVWFADMPGTQNRLELIRREHVKRGWADIGYHFVVDRAGRVWQGRDIRFQGAHVKDHNEHNIGVMVLGNFDIQQPTDAQLTALRNTVSRLMKVYRIPVGRVYTHQELMPTACPGKALQPRMVSLRRNGNLA